MSKVRSFLDELAYIWRWRQTFRGLLAAAFVLNLIALPAVLSLAYFVLNRASLLPTPEAFFSFLAGCAVAVAGTNVLLLLVWVYLRRVPIVPIGKVGVLFAPRPASGAEDAVVALYQQFVRDLESRNLTHLVSHALLPYDRPVRNHQDAALVLAQAGARVVIYGTFTKGLIRGAEQEGFESVSFSLRHPPMSVQQFEPVAQTLAGAMVLRSYVASADESFIERQVVVRNLSEVARFFIAVGLTLDGRPAAAIALLDELLIEVDRKRMVGSPDPQLEFFRGSIVRAVRAALISDFTDAYEKHLIPRLTTRAGDAAAAKVKKVVDRLVSLSGEDRGWQLATAILKFHEGDVPGAVQTVREAQRCMPVGDPAPSLSLAFLALWDGRYQDALKYYARARRAVAPNPAMVTGVLAFLESVAENNPDRPEVRYGLATVNDSFFDASVARREYAEFLRRTESRSEMSVIRHHAEQRLAILGG